MIYLLYFIILAFLLYQESKDDNKHNLYRWVIPVVYILLVGLRGQYIGVDTPVYYDHYYYFGPFGCDFVEEGFDFINRFCYAQGWTHTSFFLICALMTVLPVAYATFSFEKKEYLVFASIFYTMSFASLCNGVRQNIACGMYFAAAYYVYSNTNQIRKNIIVYLAVIAFASLFHATVLLLIPCYFLVHLKMNRNVYLFLYLASFILITQDISPYVPKIIVGVRDYAHHIESENIGKGASSLGFVVSSTLFLLIFALMYKYDLFKKYNIVANCAFLAFVLKNAAFNLPVMNRVSMYMGWFVYLTIAKFYSDYYNDKLTVNDKAIFKAVALIYFVLIVYCYVSPQNQLFPYQFFWEEQIVKGTE